MQRLVDDAAQRSPAIREWIDRLAGAGRHRLRARAGRSAQLDLDGRIGLLSAVGRPSLSGDRAGLRAVGGVADGHARTRAVSRDRDRGGAVGGQRGDAGAVSTRASASRPATAEDVRTFETEAAAAAGLRARRQLLTSTRTAMELERMRLSHPRGIQGDAGAPADAGAGDAALGSGAEDCTRA